MKIALSVLFLFCMTHLAQAAECSGRYSSVAAARRAEGRCMAISNLSSKQACLDEVTDWWYHCGGNFVDYNPYMEMTRILKVQIGFEPTRIDAISNLAYYSFSIEDDAILAGTLPDFTAAPSNAFSDVESFNSGCLEFYDAALAVPALVVAHASPAKTASRIAYYANLKANYAKACALVKSQVNPASACEQWTTTAPMSGPCGAGGVPQVEYGVCVAGKTLVRYRQYDRPSAL